MTLNGKSRQRGTRGCVKGKKGMSKYLLISILVVRYFLTTPLRAEIKISNFTDGDIVGYPLVIIKGTSAQEIAVKNRPSCISHRGNEFRIVLDIVPGTNRIVINNSLESKILNIELKPPENKKKFSACYFVPENGDERYQTIDGTDEYKWKPRIQTSLKMIQSFIAEDLYKIGAGKRTIHFVSDPNLNPDVELVKMPYSTTELHLMNSDDLYKAYCKCLKEQHIYYEDLKFIAIPSFTRGQKNHFALGGSYLATYSSIALQCWPDSTDTIDDKAYDTTLLPESMYEYKWRKTVSTQGGATIGGLMHEVGHSLGLHHEGSKLSIMQRGFEYFYAAFVFNGMDEPSFEEQRKEMINSEWIY